MAVGWVIGVWGLLVMTPAVRLLLCLALAALTWASGAAQPEALRAGLSLLVLIGALWVTQALPLALTALAVPLLAVLAGLQPPRQALAAFANPVIFLFLGGFALAAALTRHELDRALANLVLRLARGRRLAAVLLMAVITTVLSMWMSNTATAAMMLPLALGLLRSEAGGSAPGPAERAFVLLAMAYAANIGGMGTVVGSPPNAIAAAQAGIGFAQWMRLALPLVLLLLPLMLAVLAVVLRPQLRGRVAPATARLVWTRPRVITLAIFGLTVAAWVGSAPLGQALGVTADMDTVVALGAMLLLVASGVLSWREVEQQTQWSVLLLFGGGIALGEVITSSGASRYLAQALISQLQGTSPLLLVLGVTAFIVLISEVMSNTACAALLLPMVMPLAQVMGLSPVATAALVALAASGAFMLPVGTPPNAIVFATEQVPQATMMRCGFWVNVVSISLISALATWAW